MCCCEKKCECRRHDNVAGVEQIKDALCTIKEAVKCICKILKDIECCRGNLQRNTILINKYLDVIADAIDEIEDALRCIDPRCNKQAVQSIREGLCDLKKGVKCVRAGNCKIQNGYLKCGLEQAQAGVRELCEGIKDISKGLCKLND